MPADVILFVTSLCLSAVFSFVMLIYAFSRINAPGGKYVLLLQISMLIWTTGYIIEILAPTLELKMIGVKLQYFFGIPFAPVFFFYMIIHYATNRKLPDLLLVVATLIVPFINLALTLSIEQHELFYVNPHLLRAGHFLLIEKSWGPWFYVHVYYSYAIVAAASFFIIRLLLRERAVFKRQGILFILIMLLPWLANIAYVTGMSTYMRLDFSNIAFILSSALMLFGIIRHQLLDLIPAAREKIVESLEDGVVVIDTGLRVVATNPAAEKLLRYSQPLGAAMEDVFQVFGPEFSEPFHSGKRNFELRTESKVFEITVSELTGSRRDSVGRIVTIHDVTARAAFQSELAELNEMKDKFISVLAHDLKSPFLALNGLSEMLLDEFSSLTDKEKIEMVNSIHRLSGTTYFMLENLLEWSRSLTGRLIFAPEMFLLSVTMNAALEQVRAGAEQKKIILESDTPADCVVFADEPMIRTVLRNLLSNAIKFTPESGRVSVQIHRSSESVTIRVVDTGIGMPEEMIQRLGLGTIQEPRRGTAGEKGTGLGLLLCQDFIRMNKGTLSVFSEPGKGSSIGFSFPVSAQ